MRDKVVRIPTNLVDLKEWIKFLKINNIDDVKGSNKRVWLGHFHPEDIMRTTEDSSLVLVKKIDGQMGYKYTKNDKKNLMNPVPSYPSNLIDQNNLQFYNKIIEENLLCISQTVATKKRARVTDINYYSFENFTHEHLLKLQTSSSFYQSELIILSDEPKKSDIKKVEIRNKPLKSFPYQSYMGTADLLQKLEKDIHLHGRICSGNIRYLSKNYISTKGLCITTTRRCELGMNCKVWNEGIYDWASANMVDIRGEQFYSFNVKSVVSQAMNPVSKSGIEDFLRGMWLFYPTVS